MITADTCGMTATNRYVPGKRLRTWHRKRARGYTRPDVMTLRAFAREMAASGDDNEKRTASDWLRGKGAHP